MFIFVQGQGYWSSSAKAFVPLKALATQYSDITTLTLAAASLPEEAQEHYEIEHVTARS